MMGLLMGLLEFIGFIILVIIAGAIGLTLGFAKDRMDVRQRANNKQCQRTDSYWAEYDKEHGTKNGMTIHKK